MSKIFCIFASQKSRKGVKFTIVKIVKRCKNRGYKKLKKVECYEKKSV